MRGKLKIIMVAVLFIIMYSNSVQGLYNPLDYILQQGPEYPRTGHCFNESGDIWLDDFFEDPVPSNDETDVDITGKGVQTCINLTNYIQGCTVNVTFQWLNWTLYYAEWLDWVYSQNWYDYDNINWSNEPNWDNNSYWFDYADWTSLSTAQTLCAWNENVFCYTENDYTVEWFDWRVVANVTCGNYTYNTTCYYYFEPEACPISYIYPPSPNGTACPCCEKMCIDINNEHGHLMNVTIYRNDTLDKNFYQVNKYLYTSNGSYCFCIDGHINDSIYYPMQYNTTYYWYVNLTDVETGDYEISNTFQFKTITNLSLCPCGYDDLVDLIEDTETQDYKTYIIGLLGLLGLLGYFYKKRRKQI